MAKITGLLLPEQCRGSGILKVLRWRNLSSSLHGVFVLNTRMLTSSIYPALIDFQAYLSDMSCAAKLVCQKLLTTFPNIAFLKWKNSSEASGKPPWIQQVQPARCDSHLCFSLLHFHSFCHLFVLPLHPALTSETILESCTGVLLAGGIAATGVKVSGKTQTQI